MKKNRIGVIDLFAGAGGLGEGFSSLLDADGSSVFEILCSVEKDNSAFLTLTLRAFFRSFGGNVPFDYYEYAKGQIPKEALISRYPENWEAALFETLNSPRELGNSHDDSVLSSRLRQLKKSKRPMVLLGGPPCQAYSLAGRAKNNNSPKYSAENDHRHFLYREYLEVICQAEPDVFVMENVKGILTSKVLGEKIFPRILKDLSAPSKALRGKKGCEYEIYSISPDAQNDLFDVKFIDYLVKSEDFGVPQSRHRVILLGVKKGAMNAPRSLIKTPTSNNVFDALRGLPRLRSGVSKSDSLETWRASVYDGIKLICDSEAFHKIDAKYIQRAISQIDKSISRGSRFCPFDSVVDLSIYPLNDWYNDHQLGGALNHETRSHMPSDLHRYLFASLLALSSNGRSPKISEFPRSLLPKHANRDSGVFVDRFKVQSLNRHGSTITSHIAKDGHYFIHPDPSQARSLTVREAARIQTFPDNFFFEGSRSEQYVQVGNAVPPLLSLKIAEIVFDLLR